MPVYPGDPPFAKTAARSRARGDPVEVSSLTLGSHTGTHVDVPVHFLEGGADLDGVPVAAFVGPAVVVDARGLRAITAADITELVPRGARRVLFRTDNSDRWGDGRFVEDYVYLTGDGAQALVERGFVLVGIDYLSVEKFGAAEPLAHLTLLSAGVMILEGLDLSAAPAGRYFLVALPLRLAGGDGSPVRAVLLEGVDDAEEEA